MYKRLKRFWQLSKKDPKAIEILEKLTEEDLAFIPEAGDGKAVFFSEGTMEDFEEQKKEDSGLAKWYKRIKEL